MKILKRFTCHHRYKQTELYRYDPIRGGFLRFICLDCHKKKWIHIPHIEWYFTKQTINEEMGIPNKVHYLK